MKDDLVIDPRARVEELQAAMSAMPQAEGLITTHHFVPGQYLRKLWRPAGTVIVGKVHRAPHFFLCALGEIAVSSGDGNWKTLHAGDVIESQPGTKRITYALTDAIGITVHKTDHVDLDLIEAELIEPDELSLFDANNALKIPKIGDTIDTLPSR
jgi:hypothetical protein